MAIALLIAGGLSSLQAASLATALPFSIVLLMMCVATLRGLRHEQRKKDLAMRVQQIDWATQRISGQVINTIPESPELRSYVDDRIDYRLSRTRGLFRSGTSGKKS